MITYLNYRIGNCTGNISIHREEDEVSLPSRNDSISLNQPDINGTFIVKFVNGPFELSGRKTYTLDLTTNQSS
jgi:hypothetical protein